MKIWNEGFLKVLIKEISVKQGKRWKESRENVGKQEINVKQRKKGGKNKNTRNIRKI